MTTYPNLPQRRPVASRLFAVVSLLFALCFVPLLSAQENSGKKAFDIPAGDAEPALKAFAHQSGLEVLFVTEATQGVRTLAVKGEYTPREALDQLLAGTPLTATQASPTAAVRVHREKSVELAEKNVARAIAEDSARPDRKAKTEENDQGDKVVKLDTFEVFGKKTLNMDIQRTQDDALPYVTFDRKEIASSGATSLDDFFQRRLTSNMSIDGAIESQDASILPRGLNIRGLGVDETLVLVDGRRLPQVIGQGGVPFQSNFNTVPLSAIERVEVLPGSASGIYGGGATGGVINIVLRRDYSGLDIRMVYGNAFNSDVPSRRVEITGGRSFENGRSSLIFSISRSDGGELLQQDRDFFAKSNAIKFANNPSSLTSTPPVSATTNILSLGGNLTLKAKYGGGSLGSTRVTIPYGYAGPASDNGAALLPLAGSFNLDLAPTAASTTGGRISLWSIPDERRTSLTFRREINSSLSAFLEASRAVTTRATRTAPSAALLLPGTADGNPFNQFIFVTTPFLGADGYSSYRIESTRLAAGVVAKLPAHWLLEMDTTWDNTSPSSRQFSTTLLSSAQSAVSAGTRDIFRDTVRFPVSFAQYLGLPGGFDDYSVMSTLYTVRASGPLPNHGWFRNGILSLLAEHRLDDADDLVNTVPGSGVRFLSPARSQGVGSFSAELKWPIVGKENAKPFVKLLEISLAGRLDHYRTKSPSTNIPLDAKGDPTQPIVSGPVSKSDSANPTISMRYGPTKDVVVRVSYSTGFLPPNLNQLTPSIRTDSSFSTNLGLNDPLRGNEPITYQTSITGGNPALRPEKNTSWSAGLIFAPNLAPGFRASVDWVRLDKRDAIVFDPFTSQADLNAIISAAPERFGRAAPNNGFNVGPIVLIDRSAINFLKLEVDALDFAVAYTRDTIFGTISIEGKATETRIFSQQFNAGAALVDSAGIFLPQHRSNLALQWERRNWIAAWSIRYYGRYFLKADRSIDVTQGSAVIPSQTYSDLVVSYCVGPNASWLVKNTTLSVSVSNVFNKEPPIYYSARRYSPLADPRIAAYMLSIQRSF